MSRRSWLLSIKLI